MGKFKVGDRVRAYSYEAIYTGVIADLPMGRHTITVSLEGGGCLDFHPKQCRKLVRKERRRVWVQIPSYGVGSVKAFFDPVEALKANCGVAAEIVEFVEVRRKAK